jgi:hypothetical protein
MSYNAAVLKDPTYLETDYEKKRQFYRAFQHPEYTRDAHNFAFVAFLGVWYFSYGLITKRNLFGSNAILNYGSSFLAANVFHSLLLYKIGYAIPLARGESETSS